MTRSPLSIERAATVRERTTPDPVGCLAAVSATAERGEGPEVRRRTQAGKGHGGPVRPGQPPARTDAVRSLTLSARWVALVLLAMPGLAWGEPRLAVLDAGQGAPAVHHPGRPPAKAYVADLHRGESGTLLETRLGRSHAPGRYRLHAQVASAPLGGLTTGAIELVVQAGQSTRTFPLMLLGEPDGFYPLHVTFTHGRQPTPVRVHWRVIDNKAAPRLADQRALARMQGERGGRGQREPQRTTGPSLDGGLDLGGEGGFSLGDDADDGGDVLGNLDQNRAVPWAEVRELTPRLALAGVAVQPLGPLQLVRARADKLVYRPGESAHVRLALANRSNRPHTAELHATLHHGLDHTRALARQDVHLTPGETRTLELPAIDTTDLRWGAAVHAQLTGGERQRAVFAVTDNFWDVHQHTFQGSLAEFSDPARARHRAAELRAQGYTAVEALFWAPCDMFEYTPESEHFFGGQGGYPATIAGTRHLIDACHDQGIAVTFYANWWGAGGPAGLEVVRQHPDWFGDITYTTQTLDDWDLLGYHGDMPPGAQVKAPGVPWTFAPLTMPPPDAAFDRHAAQVVATHAMFGWDAIRYDSGYSSQWSVRGLRRTREHVGERGIRFSSNSFAPNVARTLMMPLFAGGCIMAEGLRMERMAHVPRWMDRAMNWRDAARPYGVHVMPLHQLAGEDKPAVSPMDELAAVAAHFASNMHVGAHPPQTPLGNVAGFARRFSQPIWDTAYTPVAEPNTRLRVLGDQQPLHLGRTLAVRELGEGRYRLVAHLLNMPGSYRLYRGFAQRAPKPWRDLALELDLPEGARVQRAVTLSPRGWLQGQAVEPLAVSGTTLRVPLLRHWRVLVVDIDSPTALPTAVTHAAKTRSIIRDWLVLGPLPGDVANHPQVGPVAVDTTPEVGQVGPAERRWTRVLGPREPVQGPRSVSFRELFELDQPEDMAGYAYTRVHAERAMDARLWARADDAIAVWLNGERVLAERLGPFEQAGPAQADVRLRAGANHLLVNVTQDRLFWHFALRLSDRTGVPLGPEHGVRYGLPKEPHDAN